MALSQIAAEMDRQLTDVMPDSWMGHARLVIHSSDLPAAEHGKAVKLSQKLINRGHSAEEAAEGAITAIKNRS